MSTQDINSVIDNHYASLRAMDWDKWVSLFSIDAVRHDVDGQKHVGEEGLRQFISGIGDLFQSVNINADSTYVTDHGTAVKWIADGVGNNGKHVEFSGIDVFKIDSGGKITEEWVYWNPAQVISELTS